VLPLTAEIQHNRRGKSYDAHKFRRAVPYICHHHLAFGCRIADRNVQQYEHELPLDSPVLQQARKGDCLLLLAKARFPVRIYECHECRADIALLVIRVGRILCSKCIHSSIHSAVRELTLRPSPGWQSSRFTMVSDLSSHIVL
jgi:hypothetical protein